MTIKAMNSHLRLDSRGLGMASFRNHQRRSSLSQLTWNASVPRNRDRTQDETDWGYVMASMMQNGYLPVYTATVLVLPLKE